MSEGFAVAQAVQQNVIALDDEWERRNWMKWLGCTEDQLRLAVETMGPDPDNVRRFLRQARY